MTRVNHYRASANFERTIKNRLEAEGYYCIRAAGSKGQCDLVAFKQGQRPLFIQVSIAKRPKPKAEIMALKDLAEEHGASPVMWTKAGPEFLEDAA